MFATPDASNPNRTRELEAVRQKIRPLWQPGDIFHNFTRFPERVGSERIDRLSLILKNGLVPPALDPSKRARSDLNIVVRGTEIPYDSVVFLHRFGRMSGLYVQARPGHITALIDPTMRLYNPDEMDMNWPRLCLDEVYSKVAIPPERIVGLVVHPQDARQLVDQFHYDFRRLAIPLYTVDGNILWPSS